ncbi:MAG: hypothetical protein WBE61_03700 [Nitrososphaeraceae archaeon]
MDGTDSSSPLPPETTEVLYGNDNIQGRVVEDYSWIQEELDGCVDYSEVSMHSELEAIYNFHVQLKRKGIRLRVVTEVTPDNISYVKKLMEVSEVRHLAGVKCNFGIVDRKVCLFHSISHEDQPPFMMQYLQYLQQQSFISFFRN